MSNLTNCPNCGATTSHEVEICGCGYDFLVVAKQKDIMDIVHNVIRSVRRDHGLSPLFNTATLGKAALSMSETVAGIEQPDAMEVVSDYRQRAATIGYPGLEVSAAYYRKLWPLDTDNNVIAKEILDFSTQALDDCWEDYGVGITRGNRAETPGEFGTCVVLGFDYRDGNALVVKHINEERQKIGAASLEIDRRLRRMSRSYLEMQTAADPKQVEEDVQRYGYLEAGYTTRFAYSGTYVRYPADRLDTGLNIRDIARLVADELLRSDRELLTRPDWQHIGLAVETKPVTPYVEPKVPSFIAEYVIGWRLPEHTERPEHFPPSIEKPPHPSEANVRYVIHTQRHRQPPRRRQRRKWWWPF